MAAAKKKTVLTVSAPLVQVQVGDKILHLFNGDIVPDGISEKSLEHLKGLDYVTESDAPVEPDNN